ncbi:MULTISPECIES: hypothetical protein [unclassified Streptomyces]|uniref:ATP-dependent DNA ligase n=1 Tax=unclassified Streptomyces TaxID=2593676 RepID=UPI0022AF4882|nr:MULTISPECIES: hypothetical protein [unclassified Streptomyces]MCZ4103564.1 hypothetical protein [Streptomyces sp. H39-C1]
MAFDLLRHGATDLTSRPYAERRAALERLFADCELGPPWALCPSTTDPQVAAEWLSWSAVGMEGLTFKRLTQRYLPGERRWQKYRSRPVRRRSWVRSAAHCRGPPRCCWGDSIPPDGCSTVGRSTVLAQKLRRALADQLSRTAGEHPWTGWSFSAGWRSKKSLVAELVEPLLVAEVALRTSRWIRQGSGGIPCAGYG